MDLGGLFGGALGGLFPIIGEGIISIFENRRFDKSEVKKSILVDIERYLDEYKESTQTDVIKIIKNDVPDNKLQEKIILKISEGENSSLKEIENIMKDVNNDDFIVLETRFNSFAEILKKELRKYEKGCNRDILMKEKNILIKEFDDYLQNTYDILDKELKQMFPNIKMEGKKSLSSMYKLIIERTDILFKKIIDRICIE